MTARTAVDAIARRMVESSNPEVVRGAEAFAFQTACETSYRIVARSVGHTGAHALLRRALGKAAVTHPALKNVRIDGMSELGFHGVSEMTQSDGEHAAAEALQAVLESFLGLLSDLIGDDLVAQLLEQGAPELLPREKEAP